MATYTKQEALQYASQWAAQKHAEGNINVPGFFGGTMVPPLGMVQSNLRSGIEGQLEDGKTYTSEELAKLASDGLKANNVTNKSGAPLSISGAEIDAVSGKKEALVAETPVPEKKPETPAPEAPAPAAPATTQPQANDNPPSAPTATVPGTPENTPDPDDLRRKQAQQQASGEEPAQDNQLVAFLKIVAGIISAVTGSVASNVQASNQGIDELRASGPQATGAGIQSFGQKLYSAIGTILSGSPGDHSEPAAVIAEAPPREREIKSTALDTKPNPEVAEYNDRQAAQSRGAEEPSLGNLKPRATPSQEVAQSRSTDMGRFS